MGRHWVLTSAALPNGHAVLGREPQILGREPGVELRLHALDVSRRHAKIWRQAGSFVIQDLGSANGTYVNGRPATRPLTLENQDLITIGTVQLQFVIVDAERDEIAQRFSPGLEETDHVVQQAASAQAQFAGSFTRETLHQVMQLIEFHKHSGVFRVESGGTVGFLRFKDGIIVDARLGPAVGDRAARALLSLISGDYAFYAWRPQNPAAAAPGGSQRLQARALIMEVLQEEESSERRRGEDGFLDERPQSDERPALPAEDPKARTQRIRRPPGNPKR